MGTPGCADLKVPWLAEQGAFCEYVRYDYPDNVRELPCTEGLGWPNMQSACRGTLVSHYTLAKEETKWAAGEALTQGVMRRLQDDMVAQKNTSFIERLNNEIRESTDSELHG